MQVEIIKIGSIIGPNSFPFLNKGDNKIILVATDGDDTYNYYLEIVRKNRPQYRYQKTVQSIVGYPVLNPLDKNKTLIGKCDGIPTIGQVYTINNSTWHTSLIEEILEECVLITKNSIYAIHNQSKLRDKKITDLGL